MQRGFCTRAMRFCLACLVVAGALGSEASDGQMLPDEPQFTNLLQAGYAILNGTSSTPARAELAGVAMLATDAGAKAMGPAGATCALVMVLGMVSAGIAASFVASVGKAPTAPDVAVWVSCTGVVLVTGIGMWGDVAGGGLPVDAWFGWHPVLMTSAFMGLMVLGRWTYATESPLGTKEERRQMHRVLMVLAAIAMLMGYISIFKAHWPDRKFFGYYFHAGQWAAWQRIVHVYLGYATILLTVAQVAMGLVKFENLKDGKRVFTFHGILGKVIITMAGATVFMAIWSSGWGSGVAGFLGAFTCACVIFGALWPTPGM